MREVSNKIKEFDNSFLSDNIRLIAGIDEAGRGPLAGPVVAAAVIFDRSIILNGVWDSKKLNEKKRDELFDLINESALSIGVGIIEHDEIDQINILQATLKAMKIAAEKLNPKPHLILIDGNKSFVSNIPTKTIVKGDQKSFAIAAASIIAKVTRDRIMKQIALTFPQYNWEKNKGYGTRLHVDAIKEHGFCNYHRVTFLSKILDGTKQIPIFKKVES
ncbi:MAG: ribonuclease HII [bacterium]